MGQGKRAAFVGEAMIELIPQSADPRMARLSPAGDVLNTAVYFRRAPGNRCAARFVTALGADPFSDRIARFAAEEAIETEGIRRVRGATCGLYAVTTAPSGERSFSYWRSASAARSLFSTNADFEALGDCALVLLTGITLAIISDTARGRLLDWVRAARGTGVRLAFDSNYRPALWENRQVAAQWTEAFWRQADIAFPSVDDEMTLFGEASVPEVLARFAGYGVGAGALKAGAAGSHLLGGSGGHIGVEPVEKVVDTTAAGDSFNAGFLAAYLNGASPEQSVRAAHALAREVIQHPGAIIEAGPRAAAPRPIESDRD